MTQPQSLSVSLVPESESAYKSCWVRLEQIMPDEAKQLASAADVYNMWMAAALGKSAVRLRPDNCPVEFDGSITRVFLGFYVWKSKPTLKYSLSAALGNIGRVSPVHPTRSFSAVVDNSDRYALPFYMSTVTVTWETPAFNEYGERYLLAPMPRLVDGIWLVWDTPVFGAIRISGIAVGDAVVLEMEFERVITTRPYREDEEQKWHEGPNGSIILTPTPESYRDSNSISDLKNAITVTSECSSDAVENSDVENVQVTTEIHDVTIPWCVKKALSVCPGEDDIADLFCEELSEKTVYFNTCNGKVLGSKGGDSGSTFCSKIVTAPKSGQGWLP